MVWTELRAGYPHSRMVRKPSAMFLQPVNEAKRIGRASLRDIIMYLPEVGAGFKSKDAAAHLTRLGQRGVAPPKLLEHLADGNDLTRVGLVSASPHTLAQVGKLGFKPGVVFIQQCKRTVQHVISR